MQIYRFALAHLISFVYNFYDAEMRFVVFIKIYKKFKALSKQKNNEGVNLFGKNL